MTVAINAAKNNARIAASFEFPPKAYRGVAQCASARRTDRSAFRQTSRALSLHPILA
jgi:hypothetical protein